MRIIRYCIIIILGTYLFTACSQSRSNGQQQSPKKNGHVQIEGSINHPSDKGYVVLEKIGENNIDIVDTLMVSSDSTFRYSLDNNAPGFYRLNLYDKQYVNLILDDEDVNIVADGNRPDGFVEVSGSTDTDHFYEVNELMREFQQKVNELNADFMKARADEDEEAMQDVESRYAKIEADNTEKLKAKINEMGNSIAAFYAVNFLDAEKEFAYLNELAEKFKDNLPDSRYTEQFVDQVEELRRLSIGMEAPDIALPNPQGDTVKLSSLQGKYVMIDFWAAWCKPCRMENPNVVRLYNKYKDKGFEIYGVSLDRTKEAWVEAIKKDQLSWVHVSDLKYFDSEAASLYNINAIPATILLDREGNIIAKNLRGKALEDKLAELFDEA
ncbi:peroxiredoxin [Catalinimonas alkaloidigena]|uniref:peroxiredoxin family protein n=1 Tax=Catalinimonas alkaloidigena TaxID=1075417 RepID=UPI0024057F73|nr:redoxin domain-containing protein [Catalinimonas alkaloidigena]MDF9799735.1 peroxiredoxin [Catalinimonas alkaloidigena]